MQAFASLLICVGLIGLISSVTAEVEPIEIKGSHLFYKNGTAFFVRGINYEPFGYDLSGLNPPPDPLGSGILCRRDIPNLSALNINTILVVNIDRDKDHSECMKAFVDAGIYVVASVLETGTGSAYVWDQEKLDHKIGIISSLANYSNLLGLRMVAEDQHPMDMPYFRAAFRDMRTYMSEVWHRNIPIILTVVPEEQEKDTIDYMWCHNDTADMAYVWLGESVQNCTTSQNIEDAVDFAKTLGAPSVLEGMRCEVNRSDSDDRNYEFMYDVYSDQGAAALSGGILQTYYGNWDENMTYAIMTSRYVSNENAIAPLPGGAESLSSVLAAAKPSFTDEAQYNPTATARPCPTGSAWDFSPVLPPRVYEPLCSCMLDTLQCTAKPSAIETISEYTLDDMLVTACGTNRAKNCEGIATNITTGAYGAFSMCNRTTVYSWAANLYWQKGGNCDLKGTAELRDVRPTPQRDCKFLLDQVGSAGEKTLTAFLGANTAPSSTAPSGTEETGGLAKTSSDDSQSSGLPTGAKIGIGIGVPFFVALCLVSVFFLLRRRRRADAALHGKEDVPEFVPPRDGAQGTQMRPNDLPEVQTLLRD
ncbi:carbohydrate-binding module family 43 protein [Karstenula rhodostoma CBS 690.94]|uniref:1,3-beta-glucanosyltransferase n=1 Tax=Karstenula rhodostoma CBS 690.94 TaxID=1392251 RepID=A0A9P4PU23_9PLEO|nr:carbohydrate-binding module family 43 protein [Karstenula rhodostoma CBS 690.94]